MAFIVFNVALLLHCRLLLFSWDGHLRIIQKLVIQLSSLQLLEAFINFHFSRYNKIWLVCSSAWMYAHVLYELCSTLSDDCLLNPTSPMSIAISLARIIPLACCAGPVNVAHTRKIPDCCDSQAKSECRRLSETEDIC